MKTHVPTYTKQGNSMERALAHFMRPTPEYATGWENDCGRPAGSRVEFNKQTLKYEVCNAA